MEILVIKWSQRKVTLQQPQNSNTVSSVLPNAGQFYFNSYQFSNRVWGGGELKERISQSPCDIFSYLG